MRLLQLKVQKPVGQELASRSVLCATINEVGDISAPSVTRVVSDAKAIISAGPLIIVDGEGGEQAADSVQSEATEDATVSGSSIPRSRFSSPPQGVVVVSRDPVARLTLWLPGQVQDPEDNLSGDLPEQQTTDRSLLNAPTNQIGPLADRVTSPRVERAAIAEDSPVKTWLARFRSSPQEADVPLPDGMIINVQDQDGFLQTRGLDAAAVTNDAGPVIHSRLELSKGADGSQTLSYEEEVRRQEGVISGCGTGGRERRRGGLRSTFLDLLR